MCVLYVILLQRYSPAYIKHSRLYCRQKRSTSPQKSSWCIVTSWSNCHLNARKYQIHLEVVNIFPTSQPLLLQLQAGPSFRIPKCWAEKTLPVGTPPTSTSNPHPKPVMISPAKTPGGVWCFLSLVLSNVACGFCSSSDRSAGPRSWAGHHLTWFLEMNLWVSWFQFKISFF